MAPTLMLDAAMRYAQRGLPVFPVNPGNKRPYLSGGFKIASVDNAQIAQWWQQWPQAMIGMPTGPASGLWVTDADVDPGKQIDGLATLAQLTTKHGPLPMTLTSVTPRGGKHFLFVWNGENIRNSSGRIGPGIDVRGDGGYIILPPSTRADGVSYQWEQNGATAAVTAPAWLIDLAKSRDRTKAWARAALEQECQTLGRATAGTRNAALNTAAFNLYQIVHGGALPEQVVRARLFEAAEACGLVADDGAPSVWATIDSAAVAARSSPRSRPGSQQRQGAPGARPIIRLNDGELPAIVDQAEDALLMSGLEFYQRGDLLVRPIRSTLPAADDRLTLGWQLLPVTRAYMVETLTRVAEFERMDRRAAAFVPKDCPGRVAETLLARTGGWRLPALLGIVNTPFLRRDGSLVEQAGYDAESGLLFKPDGQYFPAIAAQPTRADAMVALEYLKTLIIEFPFVEKVDRAVALSGILTAFDRRSLPTAPLHAFTSPVAGTGKSLLVDIVSMLVSGDLAPVIAQGKDEEELEKRLGAALIAGDALISIDNCSHELTGTFLCQALTQARVRVRLLGQSRQVETPVTAMIFANGNNLVIANDLTRRSLLGTIDAGVERPETRSFKTNVLETIRDQRPQLVAAVLTILRAWHMAGTTIEVVPLGSFEDWSFRVRQPLLWLDEADPCNSMASIRELDPERAMLHAVLAQWRLVLGLRQKHTIQQVISFAVTAPDFLSALCDVAGHPRSPMVVSNMRLGRWLKRVQGRVVNKLKLVQFGDTYGQPLWGLVEVS